MFIRCLSRPAGSVPNYRPSRHKSLLLIPRRQTRVRIEGPLVLLEPDAAQAIAVILHELATNAAKYGALSMPKARLT